MRTLFYRSVIERFSSVYVLMFPSLYIVNCIKFLIHLESIPWLTYFPSSEKLFCPYSSLRMQGLCCPILLLYDSWQRNGSWILTFSQSLACVHQSLHQGAQKEKMIAQVPVPALDPDPVLKYVVQLESKSWQMELHFSGWL